MNNLVTIDFHGDMLIAVQRDDGVFVAIKYICDRLGLDWKSQRNRLDRDTVLTEGRVITTLPSPGGPQETTLLRLDLVNGWLFGISENHVKPELRDAILTYKRECYRVLFEHFHGKATTAREEAPRVRPTAADIPLDVVRSWTNAIRETRILRGSRAAVAMWNASPFANLVNLPDFPAGSHPGGPGLDGDGCLAHLLELPVKGFGRLWEAAAAHWSGQPGARGAAKAAGVLFDPADLPGWAAVANKTPDLVRHFHGTAWAAGWNRALASLEGAARTDRVFWFTDRPSRAILLPRALFNPGE